MTSSASLDWGIVARKVATALVGPPNTTVADLIGVFCSDIAGLWLGDAVSTMTELKPKWDVHSRGDEDWLGCASEALSSALGE